MSDKHVVLTGPISGTVTLPDGRADRTHPVPGVAHALAGRDARDHHRPEGGS